MKHTVVSAASAFRNTAWLYGEKMLVMLAQLVVNVIVARQLAPEAFGTLSMVLAFIALVGPFATLGLNAIVTREIVEKRVPEDVVMGSVLILRLLGVAVGSVVMLLIAYFWVPAIRANMFLLLVLLAGNLFTFFNVLDHWFQAKMRSKHAARVRTLVIWVFTAVKVTAVLVSQDLFVYAFVQSLEWLAIGTMLFWAFRRTRPSNNAMQWDFVYGIGLLKESFWLILSGVAAVIYLKIDQIMLGSMVGEASVGIYALAVKFSEAWYFFPAALAASFFPKIIADKAQDPNRYERTLQSLLDLMFVFACLVAVSTVVLAPIVLPYVFGEQYLASIPLLNIQIWACCFVFLRAVTSKWLIAESLVRFSLASQGAGALTNVVLNYYWIPLWGPTGAAWATLVSYFVASYLAFWMTPATWPMARRMTKVLSLPLRLNSVLSYAQKLRRTG